MSAHQDLANKLLAELARLDRRLAEHEQMAAEARGKLSPSFLYQLNDLRSQHDAIAARIRDEQLHEAQAWHDQDVGPLELVDRIGRRIDTLVTQQAPKG